MIKNIVFDVGQVLMSYTPENYLKEPWIFRKNSTDSA